MPKAKPAKDTLYIRIYGKTFIDKERKKYKLTLNGYMQQLVDEEKERVEKKEIKNKKKVKCTL